jgi:hypothetical protein
MAAHRGRLLPILLLSFVAIRGTAALPSTYLFPDKAGYQFRIGDIVNVSWTEPQPKQTLSALCEDGTTLIEGDTLSTLDHS